MEIRLKVPELTKAMREYSKSDFGINHKVEPCCWHSIKRSLVENKRITHLLVSGHQMRAYETGDFPSWSWAASQAHNLKYFLEWLLGRHSEKMADIRISDSVYEKIEDLTASCAITSNDLCALKTDYVDSLSAVKADTYTLYDSVGALQCTNDMLNSRFSTLEQEVAGMATALEGIKAQLPSYVGLDTNSTADLYYTDRISNTIPSQNYTINTNGTMWNYTNTDMSNEKKEKKNMMNLNFDFGKVTGDSIRVSMYGIAIKNVSGTYVSYDVKSHSVMDVDIVNMPAEGLLYKMPVAIKDVKAGDVVIHNKTAMFVAEVHDSTLKVVDIREGTEKEIYLTKSPFGFNFATKVVSLMDMSGVKADESNPFGAMLPLMFLSGDNKDIDPMMLMLMMGQGNTANLMSNPMMMYFLMKDGKENKDMLPFVLMGMGSGSPAPVSK